MHLLEMLFVVALLLYSLVIWSHKFKKRLTPWMLWLFGIGLVADISGTVFLCVVAASRWVFNLHTMSGLIALLIMSLHFVWALLSIVRGGRFEAYFNRFSVLAWLIWLVAFVSGIPR